MIAKHRLDQLYDRYNRREWVHPDPLEFLYTYPRLEDREIIGLIASSLAYGRVSQILRSVGGITKIPQRTQARPNAPHPATVAAKR